VRRFVRSGIHRSRWAAWVRLGRRGQGRCSKSQRRTSTDIQFMLRSDLPSLARHEGTCDADGRATELLHHAPRQALEKSAHNVHKHEHAEYLARAIPGAALILLPGVSHFAPLQRPELFNRDPCLPAEAASTGRMTDGRGRLTTCYPYYERQTAGLPVGPSEFRTATTQ
jgi:hypothetical protein